MLRAIICVSRWTACLGRAVVPVLLGLAGSSTVSAGPREPAADPLACSSSLIETVSGARHLPDTDLNLSSCRRDPTFPSEWLVAVVSPTKKEPTPPDERAGPATYDIDLIVWDAKQARSVASVHDEAALLSDASELRETHIDTGRYTLSGGVRAFGVRDVHYPRCHDCHFSEDFLTLYVRDGARLRRVLRTQVKLTTDGGIHTTCQDGVDIVQTFIQPATTTSHGWYDLLLTTNTGNQEVSDKACGKARSSLLEVSYDGSTYGHAEPAPYALH